MMIGSILLLLVVVEYRTYVSMDRYVISLFYCMIGVSARNSCGSASMFSCPFVLFFDSSRISTVLLPRGGRSCSRFLRAMAGVGAAHPTNTGGSRRARGFCA
jgi:hypothetical protein